MDDGMLPHHREYEEGIIGAIIIEPRLYDEVSKKLEYMDFYVERHQWIYNMIGDMQAADIPVDLVTLRQALEDAGELDHAGGTSYLTYVAGNAVLEENLGYYVGIVKNDSTDAETLGKVNGRRAGGRVGTDADEIDKIIDKLYHTDRAGGVRRLKPVAAPDMKHIQPPPAVWADVIYPKCITQLNSEPGAGKSTLAYNLCALGAMGQPFLDVPFSKRLKSLYIDLETPDFLIRHKIELISGELPGDLHVLDRFDLKDDFREFLSLCKEERYDLVVLDT